MYPDIRIFFRPHEQINNLPSSPAPLPLLVFIHGLGGSVAQFHPLLISLVHVASCLAIDLPGCGASAYRLQDWKAYRPENLLELLNKVIESYRNVEAGQKVILIGHSMGTALAARLANRMIFPTTLRWSISAHVAGLIAICPAAGRPGNSAQLKKLFFIPEFIFNLWRAYDRRGGPESASVKRFVGPNADFESKRLQDRFNTQSRTPVWRRMAFGVLESLPGQEAWQGLDIPIFLVGGTQDNITPPEKIDILELWIAKVPTCIDCESNSVVAEAENSCHHGPIRIEDITDEDFRRVKIKEEVEENPITPSETGAPSLPPQPNSPPKVVVKKIIEGTHALLYTPASARVLASLISDFLASHITGRLEQSWQLQYLSREGKWDVKNLAKWQKVDPVSAPIGGIFRAMKTLREVDEIHTPTVFVVKYGKIIRDVIDISHQTPVYDSTGIEKRGIRYHKFPTVSKIPPTDEEVERFIQLVDRIRVEQNERAEKEGWEKDYSIGVHCHYGFNRTGYFIVCYLVERCGYLVDSAISHFAESRPLGIKHQHFLDKLFLRYSGSQNPKLDLDAIDR